MSRVFPFVVGCGRSGTTLLRAMLDAHPDLAVPPESYFVVPALRTWERTPPAQRVARVLDELCASESFREWGLAPQSVREQIRACAPASAGELLTAVYGVYARAHGKRRFADKTPYHVLHVALLAEAIPQATFVHLIRDGRDVVPSLLDVAFGPNRFPAAALYWRRHVEAGRRAGRLLGPERYLEIRYERLVRDPEATLRELCAFLELDFCDRMLRYERRAAKVLAGLRNNGHLQGIREPLDPATRDWRSSLSPRELQLFEAVAGPLRAELGYETPTGTGGLDVRLQAWSARAAVGLTYPARALRVRSSRLARRTLRRMNA